MDSSEENWSTQPTLKHDKDVKHEQISTKANAYSEGEYETDEQEELLARSTYWKSLTVAAWVRRFVYNSSSFEISHLVKQNQVCMFADKPSRHTHEQVVHQGQTSDRMATIRNEWWIP